MQVKHVCQVAEEMQRMGKCVVIGLQSTGEARTLEAVEVGTRDTWSWYTRVSVADP